MATQDTLRSLTGMHDLLPPESARWRAMVDLFASAFGAAGYGEVATPVLEELAVFQRVGEGTDVVSKEMYEFRDRDGSMIALRPESTAGVARAFVQHHPVTPWKVWYFSEHFRHERAQRGRTRQHHQLGVECFGVADPDLDVEVVVALWDFLQDLGLRRLRLEMNDIGTAAERAAFVDALRAVLAPIADQLDPEDHPKVTGNTLRILDSKRSATRRALGSVQLPELSDFTSAEGAARFERVLEGLRAAGIEPVVNPVLVRGLDYYNGTVFEIVSEAIDAAQSTIGGGGRYDGLIESLGGDPTPGFGFGAGVERILLACDAEGVFDAEPPGLDAFVVGFGGDGTDERDLCRDLRRAGFAVDRAYDGRSGRAQMKLANRSGAAWALIVGDDERAAATVTVRDLRGGGDQHAVPRSNLIDHLRGLAADPARTS